MTDKIQLETDGKLDQPHTGVGQANTKQTNIKAARIDTIATAIDSVNLTEPSSPYHSAYPYNRAKQSLSGHLSETDDTPGAERIMEMHKSGTFYEIHPDGTKVTKIFGDDFYICLENHNLIVGGNLNITVQGDANLLVKGNLTQKIGGDLNTIVHGNMTTRVRGNTLHYTKGNSDTQTRGEMKFRSNLSIEFRAINDFILKTGKAFIARASGVTRLFSKGRTWIDGSRIDLNAPGTDPGSSSLKNLDPGAGLNIPDSVVHPSIEQQILIKTDSDSALGILSDSNDTKTYPKNRIKID